VPHAHSHGSRSALTRADPAGLANPARSFACSRWPPCFGSHLPFHLMARPPTPSVPPWRLRRLDHVCETRRGRDLPGHVSHDHRAGRAPTPGAKPFIPRPPSALEATPETRCRDGNHRAHVAKPHVVTLLATGTAIYQGFLVPMRGASVLRPSTQALDGVPCPPASRLGPPLAARYRLTLHYGPLPGDWPVRLLRDSFGWGGNAGRRIRVFAPPTRA
jgi:hypothetical protein